MVVVVVAVMRLGLHRLAWKMRRAGVVNVLSILEKLLYGTMKFARASQ
jgi:hypothetical protein